MVDSIIEFPCWLPKGDSVISIESADGDATGSTCPEVSLLLVSLAIATDRALVRREIARRRSASDGSQGGRDIAFVVRAFAHAERLDTTLTSLVDAGVGRRSIFVENDGDPLTREIAERFEPHVEALVEPGSLIDEALHMRGYGMRFDITAGDQLVAGALEIVRGAMQHMNLDEVSGLTDSFDSFGRPIYRVIGSDSRLRAFGNTSRNRAGVIGCTLFSRNNAPPIRLTDGVPSVVLHAADLKGHRLPPMLAAVKGFALLGCDTYLVHGLKDQVGPSASLITIACGEQSVHGEILIEGAQIHVSLEGVGDITGPFGHNIDALRYITRRQARLLFGIDDDCFIIALFADHMAALEGVLLDLVSHFERSRRVGIILCGGEIRAPELERLVLYDLRETFDPQSEPYVLAAVDVFLQFGLGDERLATAAAMARTLYLSKGLAAAELVRRMTASARSLDEARNHAVAWQSEEAFALSLREHASRLVPTGPLARWFSQLGSLATGRIELHTDFVGLLNAKASCSLVPILGARWARTLDEGVLCEVIECTSPDALLALEVRVVDVVAIHLRVRAEQSAEYELLIDGTPVITRYLDEGIERELTVDAALVVGTHSFGLRRIADDRDVVLTLFGVEVLASQLSRQAAMTDLSRFTYVPRYGREVLSPREHGDWHRLEGFYQIEDAHPQFGLHDPFRWSQETFKIAVWSEYDRKEKIKICVRGNHSGQMLRLQVDSIDYDWCSPLNGALAQCQKRQWVVSLKQGSNTLHFTLSSTSGSLKERLIGIILDCVSL